MDSSWGLTCSNNVVRPISSRPPFSATCFKSGHFGKVPLNCVQVAMLGPGPAPGMLSSQVRAKAWNMWAQNLLWRYAMVWIITFRKCRHIVLQLSYQLWTTLHTMISVHVKAHILTFASYTWSRTYSIWATSLLRCQAHLWSSSHALRPPLCEAGWAWPCDRCCIRIPTENFGREIDRTGNHTINVEWVIDGWMDGWIDSSI